jgi:hypothetical protein
MAKEDVVAFLRLTSKSSWLSGAQRFISIPLHLLDNFFDFHQI